MNEDKFVVKTADSCTSTKRELWFRIAAHSFEDPEQSLSFTARLARDHGWSIAHARRAIEEYRRFCFLAVTGTSQMTPSEEVDEVWHQHLTYSRDYWDEWCGRVLQRPLHHQPTKGGPSEGSRFVDQYAETLARYEEHFGPPDPLFWPGTAERFAGRPRFRTVDLDRAIVLPLPQIVGRLLQRIGVLVAVATLAISSPAPTLAAFGPFDWPGDTFGPFYAILVVAALLGVLAFRVFVMVKASGPDTHRREFSPIELALMIGGPHRATDVLALDLLAAGHIAVEGDTIRVLPRPAAAGASLADLLRREGSEFTRSRMYDILMPSVRPHWRRLAQEGLVLSSRQALSIWRVALWLLAPVILLGLLKIVIGISRGKPVGLAIFLIIVTLVLGAIVGGFKSLATWRGLLFLRDLKLDQARALRAPRPSEVTMAFAVMGAVALAGTALEAYAGVLPKSDAGSGCGSGGDGGGGCGGCG